VRPTDEDQPGSRRPNLMSSSRRSSGEVNILAMLDGLGARRPARRKLRWYGVGAVLALALVGTLAWMVHDPAPVTGQPTVAEALPAPVVMAADRSPTSAQAALPAPAPAPAVAPAASGGATIVNLPAVAGADARPALADTAPPATQHAAPAPDHVPARAHSPAPAPKAAPTHPSGRTAVAAVHPAAHPASKRPIRANRSGAAPAAMDTDVALITAIIQHVSNQHGAAQDGCADKPCEPHTPPRP
jgi:hypothetical protein